MLLLADKWKDYELIDMGNGEKLERWGDIVLRRPDPQVMWPIPNESGLWKNPHGHYHRSNRGGGQWEHKKKYPERWTISYKNLKFNISPTGFKHTGLFPEQAANWDWAMDKIENAKRPIKVLNLFAYTGGATVACAAAGAEVCHVDASKGMVTWAKENLHTSGLGDRKVRFIVDDVVKFAINSMTNQTSTPNFNYLNRILMKYEQLGIHTIEQAEKLEKQHQESLKRVRPKQKKKSKRRNTLPF